MNDFVIVQESQSVIFKCEGSVIAKVVADKSFKLYNGGLVVEDGTPYHILVISQRDNETMVTLIYQDHYQIHYQKSGPVIYTSDDNYIDEA